MIKWVKRIFVILLVIFSVLWLLVRFTADFRSANELEELFWENENEFRKAAQVLADIFPPSGGIKIDTKNIYADANDERIVVKQINGLFFISSHGEDYSQKEYQKMHDAVESLFSSLKIEGVAGGKNVITFCVSLSYGIECDIIYTADGTQPTVFLTVEDQAKICDGWYAIISHD